RAGRTRRVRAGDRRRAPGPRPPRPRPPPRPPGRAGRWPLPRLYGGLFLAAGAGLLAITYLLVAAFPGKYAIQGLVTGRGGPGHKPPRGGFLPRPASAPAQAAPQQAAHKRPFLLPSPPSPPLPTLAPPAPPPLP